MDKLILTPQEEKRLKELEEGFKIARTKTSEGALEMGGILTEIHKIKLYRKNYANFDDYCRDELNIAKRTAYQLINAFCVIENVRRGAQIKILPSNERQTRPLTKLPTPELQQEAWKKAIETAPEGKITAYHVSKIVSQTLGEEIKKKMKKTRKGINKEDLISDEFKEAYDRLVGAIQNARGEKWKTTSKEIVLKYLESLKNILLIGA